MDNEGNPEQAATLEELQAKLKEVEKKAETYEKRFKDTQGAFTKSQQELKATIAAKELLEQRVGSLTVQETEELEELRLTDPHKWRLEINKLESQEKQRLQEELSQVSAQAAKQVSIETQKQILEDFNKRHPEFQLSDEMIAYDVPLRLQKKLESGEFTYEEFLDKAKEYIYDTPKKIGDNNKVLNQPNLGDAGGADLPDKSVTAKDIVDSYKNETY